MPTHRLAHARRFALCLLIAPAARGQTADSATLAGRTRAASVSPGAYRNKIPVGAALFTLDSTELMSSVGESFSAVLQARLPGLSVLRSGGSAAEGSRVQLRGPHSFYMATEPIVIVDGIRVNAMQESSIIDVGVRTSRLDDIAVQDIARVDVLPGPATASMFGPGATGGALVITSKRGAAGGLRWSGHAESRVGMKPEGFPANYMRRGTSTSPLPPPYNCDLQAVASGACTPTGLDVWNPLEEASPFRATRTTGGHFSVAGGVKHTTARLSASGQRTLGLTGDDDDGRLNLRAAAAQRLGDAFDLNLNGGYTRTSAALPLSGNHTAGVITSGLFGRAVDDATHGYLPYAESGTRQRAKHWNAGGTATWRPMSWFSATAVYGRDQLDQRDLRQGQFGSATFFEHGDVVHGMTTTSFSADASYGIAKDRGIRGQTTIGYDRLGSVLEAADSVTGAFSWMHLEWVFSGPWVRQQVRWRDRLVVGAGLRKQNRKGIGDRTASATFKSADASWSLGDAGPFQALRVRGAYGEGGAWIAGNPAGFGQPGGISFTDPSFAEPVERTAESELGVDLRWGTVAKLAVTAFRSDGSKLYYIIAGPPSVGFPGGQATPDARMRNDGLELSAQARLVDRGAFRWDATLSGGLLRNRVTSLGPYPPVIGGDGISTVGHPIASYWSRISYTFADANRDGIIDTTEVHAVNQAAYVGPSLPTREAGLSSTLSLPGSLTAMVLLDYRGGHKLSNDNELQRCRRYWNCRAVQDPTAPLEDQARAVLLLKGYVTSSPFIEDASFLKLRELALTWSVPGTWAHWFAGNGAAVSLAGRNLATWTKYRGVDPELNYRRFDQLPRAELGKSPVVREVVVRLEIGGGPRH